MQQVKEKNKKSKFSFLYRFLLKIGVLVLVVFLILTYVLGLYRMNGNDMYPSVRDGDLCIYYRLDDCYSDDVVFYKDDNGNLHIGRIIAIEGQTIDFPENGGFLINGYQPAEKITYQTFADEEAEIGYPITVKEDEYFIMNDYRSETNDSRKMGVIRKDQIKGKLIFLLRRRGF